MAWEEDKKEYIDKLESIKNGIEKILNLQGNGIVNSEMRKTLEVKLDEAAKLLRKLEKDEFEIAVVGLEKAGKSSFTNAFIELTALPTDDQRCTYTSTCIRAADKEEAIVNFYSLQDFRRDFHEKLGVLEIPDANNYSPENMTLAKYEQLFEECSDTIKKLYQDTLNQDLRDTLKNWAELKKYVGAPQRSFQGSQVDSDEFKEFITDPAKAIAVRDVVVYSSKFKAMDKAVMYDVPGFNSPTAMHQEQTEKKMKDADAIIMVAKAHEPSLTGEVLKVFKKQDTDLTTLGDKLFVFANKADMATDLEKNKQVTYNEWMERWKILPQTERGRNRIIFGSANAYLGDKVSNGMLAREGLASKGITDGIQSLRGKLEEYYKTERFEVLKKRVGKIINDVEAMFADKKVDYANNDVFFDITKLGSLAMTLMTKVSGSMKKDLAAYKYQVNTEAREQRPLTTKLRESIKNSVTTEHYQITDAEITDINNEISGQGAAAQPQKLDSIIREQRFNSMYGDFNLGILESTGSRHKLVCDRIVEICMNCLGVSSSCPDYQKLCNEVVEMFSLDKNEDDIYYHSLVERFARDLFEVQIKYTQGSDRLHKFKEEVANFFSLGIFYNASDGGGDKNDVLSYINTSPNESPLWRIILYPENAGADEGPDLIQKFKDLTGIDQVGEKLKPMIEKIGRIRGKGAVKVMEVAFKSFVKTSPPAVLFSTAKDILGGLLDEEDCDPASQLRDVLTGNAYQVAIANKHQEYTYDTVRKEFDEDIVALNRILLHAFVPAANLDKAFSARESILIEKIIDMIQPQGNDNNKFVEFLARNLNVIEHATIDRINSEQEQRRLDVAVMNEINKILKSLANH